MIAHVIIGAAEISAQGNLPTLRKAFANFRLRADVRFTGPGNGGVLFRSDNAYQLEIEATTTGSIALAKPFAWLAKKEHGLAKPGTWFTLELIANGPHLISKVDGHTVANVTDATATRGVFGLELDGRDGLVVVGFRKIEIK